MCESPACPSRIHYCVFQTLYGSPPSDFLTHWLQRPLSMSSRLNQILRRQHNAGVKSLSFRVQALTPNPKAAIYKLCDDGQVIYLLSVKRGTYRWHNSTGLVWRLQQIIQSKPQSAGHPVCAQKSYPFSQVKHDLKLQFY